MLSAFNLTPAANCLSASNLAASFSKRILSNSAAAASSAAI